MQRIAGDELMVRDVDPADLEWVSRVLSQWDCTDRWSLASSMSPSPEQLTDLLWLDVPLQAVVTCDEPLALLQITRLRLEEGLANLDFLIQKGATSTVEECLLDFVDAGLTQLGLRMLRLWVGADEVEVPPALVARAEHIGALAERRYRSPGIYADVDVYEIHRRSDGSSVGASPGVNDTNRRKPERRDPTVRWLGRHVSLEPLRTEHMDGVWHLLEHDAMIGRWPMERRRLSSSNVATVLWQVSNLQFAIRDRSSGAVVGLVQALSPDRRDGTVELGVFIDPDLWNRGWPLEGVLLFLDWLFEVEGFRRVYCDVSDSTLERLRGALRHGLKPELHLKAAELIDGAYMDRYVLSLARRDWDSELVPRVARS